MLDYSVYSCALNYRYLAWVPIEVYNPAEQEIKRIKSNKKNEKGVAAKLGNMAEVVVNVRQKMQKRRRKKRGKPPCQAKETQGKCNQEP